MNVNEILLRVGETIGSRSNVDVAKALKVPPQSISNWKARQTIPWKELYVFSRESNVSMEWLLTGEGEARPPAASPAMQGEAARDSNRILVVQRLLDLLEDPNYAESAEAAIRMIHDVKRLKERMHQIEARVEQLETEPEDLPEVS